ncbi:Sulfhydrogenase 1 subunit gamma [uncultured archaeon]|nr:Sulfhydrogenase 1 subunit gamma [uncultured archaeon]
MVFEAEVRESIQRTGDVISIRFTKPAGFDYRPGQFIFISVGSGDHEITKHLSISSSPTEGFLEVTKRLTGHPFSNALISLKEGDKLRFKGPFGKFTFQGEHEKIAMLSGGIGITPLRSVIKYVDDKMLDTDMILLYSNRHENDIAFKKEFEELMAKNLKLRIINTVTMPGPSWSGITGRINTDMIKKHIPDYSDRVFYISGPTKMVDSMLTLLTEISIPINQIKKEIFTGYD